MSTPEQPTGPVKRPNEPNVAIGMSLLVVAGVLIVVVLVQPAMSSGLKTTIAILAILVVVALLAYAVRLWMSTRRGGRGQ